MNVMLHKHFYSFDFKPVVPTTKVKILLKFDHSRFESAFPQIILLNHQLF